MIWVRGTNVGPGEVGRQVSPVEWATDLELPFKAIETPRPSVRTEWTGERERGGGSMRRSHVRFPARVKAPLYLLAGAGIAALTLRSVPDPLPSSGDLPLSAAERIRLKVEGVVRSSRALYAVSRLVLHLSASLFLSLTSFSICFLFMLIMNSTVCSRSHLLSLTTNFRYGAWSSAMWIVTTNYWRYSRHYSVEDMI